MPPILILKLINCIKSIISVLILNLLINFNSKKVILFYFPRNDLTLKDLNYIDDLLNNLNNKYLVIYGHKLNKINKRNFYFINESFLKYLSGVNLFISNYICDFFPIKSKRIYIHHSLYDTPLTGKKNENKTIDRIKKYDYIFLSSKKIIKSFTDIFKIANKNTKIISTGYPRLDYFKKFKSNKKKHIIIAPANFLAYPDHTLIYSINAIIKSIKKISNLKIIFRPHPANRVFFNNTKVNKYVDNFLKKYAIDKNIVLDFSEDYSKSYYDSVFMITDLSSTAFTYSFLTYKPVIFFSPKENLFKKNYNKLNHFKDRKKIGIVNSNIKSLEKSVVSFLLNSKKFKKSIKNVKSKLDYVGKSKSKTLWEIRKIIEL
tara:strand:+ start:4237 stop:5358 length:1122 start_codon:yes stop_codon:yes gene_type:complete